MRVNYFYNPLEYLLPFDVWKYINVVDCLSNLIAVGLLIDIF